MTAPLSTDQIVNRLLAAAPSVWRAWQESEDTYASILRGIVARVREEQGSDAWTVEQAIRWMVEQAEALVGRTVFEGQRMAKDEIGASGSTYNGLLNYAQMGETAPLHLQADALELLRIHSRSGQVDRADFDSAYDAIAAAMHAEGNPMPREGVQTYIPNAQHAEKLRGGGSYTFDKARKVINVVTGASREVGQAIRTTLRGMARYRDPSNRDFTIVVDPRYAEQVGAEFERLGYSELGDRMKRLAGYWRTESGVRSADEERQERAGAADVTPTAETGAVNREQTRWMWEPDAFRLRLFGPIRSLDVARTLGNGAGFERNAQATGNADAYFVTLATRADTLGGLLTGLERFYPATVAAMRPFLSTWTATRSTLAQSRDAGRTEEGRWELLKKKRRTTKGVVEEEYVQVWAQVAKDPETGEIVRWWRSVPGADPGKHDGRTFSVIVPVRRMSKLIEAIRPYYVRLAEAMSRAFGGVAAAVDEEAEACAARVDLHDKLAPVDVTHPDAIEAVEQVQRAFRARVPAGLNPLPFQVVGIAFAKLNNYRTLIGDAPGLGKTIQGLGCLITDPEMLLPAIIVAPKNVTANWQAEAAKWMPTVPTVRIETGADMLPSGASWRGITIMSWDMLVAHQQEIIASNTACIIADEAHYAKNPEALRTQALVATLAKVPHGVLLTGTPIKNVIVELHTLLAALDPETWGTRKAFADAYVAEQKRLKHGGVQYVGVQNVDPLQTRLHCAMVRRKKEDALKDLPAKRRVYFQVEMNREQAAEYAEAEEEFEAWYEATLEEAIEADLLKQGIAPETASKQARTEAAERVERAVAAKAIVKLGALRRLVGSIKTQPAIDLARRLVSEGENVVIFAEHKPVIKGITQALTRAGILYGVIDGEASADERQEATRAFQAGQLRVIVASQAGKEGLTLTRAANTLFVERYWTPADEQQAEDRIHRIGQTRPVVITYLHVPGTVDDKMHALIEAKRKLVDQVIGDDKIEAEDRTQTQADFIRSLLTGRRSTAPAPTPVEMRPVREAAETLTRAARSNPGAPTATIRRSEVQSIMFDRRAWTPKTVAHWLKINGYRVVAPVTTTHYLTAEQNRADSFAPGTFRTVNLTSSVRAIVGRPR
jgi:superfamily II DNA or RNA helicase